MPNTLTGSRDLKRLFFPYSAQIWAIDCIWINVYHLFLVVSLWTAIYSACERDSFLLRMVGKLNLRGARRLGSSLVASPSHVRMGDP